MTLFALPEDQIALRDTARAFAAEKIAPFALKWDEEKHFPVETIREAATLGMGGIYIRDDVGGSGLTRLDAALIFEALAQGCPTVSAYISIHNMAAWMIDAYGSIDQRTRYLPKLCSMQHLASYCLTEPGAGSDAAALRTTAKRDGEYYVLNGAKQFISGAGAGDLYVVMVRTGGEGPNGISTLVVEGNTPGISLGANERKMGWNAQPTRAVMFENVRVPVANRLGDEGMGFRIAMAGLDGGRLNIGACSLGGAQAALDTALAYMRERKAFGKRLDEFQALQFRLADMATELEAARVFLYSAAAAYDRGDADVTMRCAMAKRVATDVGFEVANQALQLHGGYGYLSEYGIEKIVRDLRVHQILEGTNEIMRLIVARKLIEAQSMTDSASVLEKEDELVVTTEGSLGVIRLNRPKALNALTLEMVRAHERCARPVRGGLVDRRDPARGRGRARTVRGRRYPQPLRQHSRRRRSRQGVLARGVHPERADRLAEEAVCLLHGRRGHGRRRRPFGARRSSRGDGEDPAWRCPRPASASFRTSAARGCCRARRDSSALTTG